MEFGFGPTFTKPETVFKVAHQPLTNAINVYEPPRAKRTKTPKETNLRTFEASTKKIKEYIIFFLAYNN